MSPALTPPSTSSPTSPARRARSAIALVLKFAVAALVLAWIVRMIRSQRGAEDFSTILAGLRWEWIAIAFAVHAIGVAANVTRWHLLLRGQGIKPSWSFLIGSLLIARFFGAVSPGGFTGFGGWRIYDVAKHTGKVARATATIAVETLVGWLAFGTVVMIGSFFGARFLGTSGVALVNAAFAGLIGAGVLLLVRPGLFASVARLLPTSLRARVQTLVEALGAYRGQARTLVLAVGCAGVVHTTHFLIYVCTAQAVGAQGVGVGEVFFGSALQILAAMLPITPNGIGVRELTALSLYESVGVPAATAVLIPMLGFAVEMSVSMLGAPFFIARRRNYHPKIEVQDELRETEIRSHLPVAAVPEHQWPKVARGAQLGLGAGLLAGATLGLAEGAVVVASGRTGYWVLAYGALAYAVFCGSVGVVAVAASAWLGRLMKREAVAEPRAYARSSAAIVAVFSFAIVAFRIRRDVFEEQLKWASIKGLGVALAVGLGAVLLYALLATIGRIAIERRPLSFLLRGWGTPVAVSALIAAVGLVTTLVGQAEADGARPRPAAPAGAGNLLVIVVDTLRADHLTSYGYDKGHTPHLDAFAADSIRFDQAFANASWTRPSFASILTGRYPSSHGVMAKSDALPSELTTLGEAFGSAGWHTAGIVTNYNVGPYFHFDQGFDEYRYLEPEFVLWADDSAAKLLLVQFLRQKIEGVRDALFGVQPGTAYRDARTVNAELFRWLDRAPAAPWLMFAAYMDPHDPYFEHPYSGSGYARAAHQTPSLEERDRLVGLYDGEITYWDENFGALIAELRRRGLYDDMTIVVTSDHGEEFADHGGFWHGTTLYDEQLRVPLFVKLPAGRRAGTVVRHWVESVDLMPTLLRESNLSVPDGVQGGNLFEGSEQLFSEESHEGNVLASVRVREGMDELKLITANPGNPRGLAESELYRTDRDPGERENLASTEPRPLGQAQHALTAARVRASEGAAEGEQVDLDCQSMCQLCDLGYMSGESCQRCNCN